MSSVGQLLPNGSYAYYGTICNPGQPGCNFDTGSPNLNSGVVEYLIYGYNVERVPSYAFTALFGLSLVLHLFQLVRYRQHWLLYTTWLGTGGEFAGWVCRLVSALSTTWVPQYGGIWASNGPAFFGQICALIISPAFYAAANYLLLDRISRILGRQYMPLYHKSYIGLFITGDVVSLLVQATGGALASTIISDFGSTLGADVMVGGVMFQMLVMIGYSVLLAVYVWRWSTDRPCRRQREIFNWLPMCCLGRRAKERRRTGRGDELVELASTPSSEAKAYGLERRTERGYERGAKLMLGVCVASTTLVFIR